MVEKSPPAILYKNHTTLVYVFNFVCKWRLGSIVLSKKQYLVLLLLIQFHVEIKLLANILQQVDITGQIILNFVFNMVQKLYFEIDLFFFDVTELSYHQ